MAGCFGNSPIDRDMERQLNDHLNSEAEFEEYLENVSSEIDPDLWDGGLETFFEKDNEVQKLLQDYHHRNIPAINAAFEIEKLYSQHN